jgi:hypothetical protein
MKTYAVFLVIATSFLLTPLGASTESVEIEGINFPQQRNNLELRSTATATWMKFIEVYVAALYAPGSSRPEQVLDGSQPLSLDIGYLRPLKREQIIKAAELALARQHDDVTLLSYIQELEEIHSLYRHINKGDHYRIDYIPGDGLRLLLNDNLLIHIKSDDFALLYLGIWLDDKPLSEPLRTTLLDWSDS